MLARREKTERVTDLVNLDRVRGLLRTVYWRRRFLAESDERRRILNAEIQGIPAIVLDPTPASPSLDEDPDPFHDIDLSRSPTPPRWGVGGTNDVYDPQAYSRYRHSPGVSINPSDQLNTSEVGSRHSPSMSVSTIGGRRISDTSMLSENDAHYR